MNRLTKRDAIGQALLAPEYNDKYDALELIDILLDRLAAYEDTGLEPEEIEAQKAYRVDGIPADRFVAILTAEAEGRLLVLPCKVGDTVYCHIYTELPRMNIDKGTVYAVSINGETNWFSARYKSGLRYDYTWDDLGKTVFRSYEEAEADMRKEKSK